MRVFLLAVVLLVLLAVPAPSLAAAGARRSRRSHAKAHTHVQEHAHVKEHASVDANANANANANAHANANVNVVNARQTAYMNFLANAGRAGMVTAAKASTGLALAKLKQTVAHMYHSTGNTAWNGNSLARTYWGLTKDYAKVMTYKNNALIVAQPLTNYYMKTATPVRTKWYMYTDDRLAACNQIRTKGCNTPAIANSDPNFNAFCVAGNTQNKVCAFSFCQTRNLGHSTNDLAGQLNTLDFDVVLLNQYIADAFTVNDAHVGTATPPVLAPPNFQAFYDAEIMTCDPVTPTDSHHSNKQYLRAVGRGPLRRFATNHVTMPADPYEIDFLSWMEYNEWDALVDAGLQGGHNWVTDIQRTQTPINTADINAVEAHLLGKANVGAVPAARAAMTELKRLLGIHPPMMNVTPTCAQINAQAVLIVAGI